MASLLYPPKVDHSTLLSVCFALSPLYPKSTLPKVHFSPSQQTQGKAYILSKFFLLQHHALLHKGLFCESPMRKILCCYSSLAFNKSRGFIPKNPRRNNHVHLCEDCDAKLDLVEEKSCQKSQNVPSYWTPEYPLPQGLELLTEDL